MRSTPNNCKVLIVGITTVVAEIGAFYLVARLKESTETHMAFALFFPIATVLSIPFLHVVALALMAMLAQFPVYGYLLGQGWIRGHLRRTALRLSGFHAVSALAGASSLILIRQ